jgi:hypothetical protein
VTDPGTLTVSRSSNLSRITSKVMNPELVTGRPLMVQVATGVWNRSVCNSTTAVSATPKTVHA